jgi:hypothetical protein
LSQGEGQGNLYPQNDPEAWDMKVGGMTRNQYLRQMAELESRLGPDQSKLHHQFANGWSVARPKLQRDVKRVGELLGNCWQSGFPGGDAYVLRDPDQVPKVAWNVTAPHMAGDGYTPPGLPPGQQVMAEYPNIKAPSGHNNSPPKPEHWGMIQEWAAAQNPPVKMMFYKGQMPVGQSNFGIGDVGSDNPYESVVAKTAGMTDPDVWG